MCDEIIKDEAERKNLLRQLSAHHEIVTITYEQLLQFAGNMLLVKNRDREKFWVMSDQAFQSLKDSQADILKKTEDYFMRHLARLKVSVEEVHVVC